MTWSPSVGSSLPDGELPKSVSLMKFELCDQLVTSAKTQHTHSTLII